MTNVNNRNKNNSSEEENLKDSKKRSANPKKAQMNVYVNTETKEYIEGLALQDGHKDKRNGKAILADYFNSLVNKLKTKEIIIKKSPDTSLLYAKGNEYNANVILIVQNLPGTLNIISRVFHENNVQIVGIDTSTPESWGFIDLIVRLEDNKDIKEILNKISDLRLREISDNAKQYIIEKWFKEELYFKQHILPRFLDLNINEKTIHEIMKMNFNNEDDQAQIIEMLGNSKLTKTISCNIAILVQASLRVGLLDNITAVIAKKGVNIMSVFRNIDEKSRSNTHFYLEWKDLDTMNAIREELISEHLRENYRVDLVQFTDVGEVFQRFSRLHASEIRARLVYGKTSESDLEKQRSL